MRTSKCHLIIHFEFFLVAAVIMDLNTIVGALRHCGRIQAFKNGKALHCQLIKYGFWRDVFVANNLIAMYVDFTSMGDAENLFGEMPVRNVVTWTTMISGYTIAGSPVDGLRIFNLMSESGSEQPNCFTYSAALKACALSGNLELGKSIHRSISGDKLQSDTVLMNTVLDMYVKCGSLSNARKVFDEDFLPNSNSWNTIIAGYLKEAQMEEAVNLFHKMPKPDTVTWNTIISGFAHKESPETLKFLAMMHREGFKLDQFTFSCALNTCGCLSLLTVGKQIHCCVVKSGFELSCFTGSALIDMYSKCSAIGEAIKWFDQYPRYQGSVHDKLSLYNSMLSGYAVNKYNVAALDLVSQIHSLGLPLDSYTFSSSLKVSVNLFDLKLGLQLHGIIITSGYESDYVVGSVLTDFYAENGNIKDALKLFQKLTRKDIISWSSLIACCVKKGLNLLVFSLFKDMVYLDFEVDQFVLSSVLKACCNIVALEAGKQVHAYCVKSAYEMEEVIITSLIHMYTKCGDIEAGLTLFNDVSRRDTICWTEIIVGCAQNGRATEAIRLFQEMLKSGVEPNEITFLGVLSACKNVGLTREAWIFLKAMESKHGLKPRIEHYCCMVDLLGRAGCFEEAEKLIAVMPYEPNETIWLSLLGACGIHNNIELAIRIAQNLFAVSPQNPSIYVTLSNIYASLGMWTDSTKLRELIRETGMKEAGLSWIVVRS
ncbi:PREDICTED: pentatricopeptide repeat-containing protein At4g08210 [Nelumbo nucifera]|uniref:Pentatricopeptide repeat-containing protein At4g08210 n=2 Tax=Nelumbo nucifera TaxID=4432 RepID=A0A822Z843_NELNU|nr:PREDICTED: pentatricopeptide repeat-containing protein At4g08210 [Nelumbo nucifera]DAD39549.1 TPA_asm: hypothetical protein HUJ06_013872 [Nelumbo nucifera]